MLNKKRMLVSLGAGILIFVVGLLSILLVWRILGSPGWMTIGIIWIIVWPFRLVWSVFSLPYPASGSTALALTSGIVADVGILSGLIYIAWSSFKRKTSRPTPTPPPPPPSY